jgi:cell wall assembly regulator SMI1
VTSVTDAWARIEGWIGRYAPVSATALAKPADPDAITAAEAELGLTFPSELVESLRRHDGLTEWANVLPEAAPLSVTGIVAKRRMRMEIADGIDGFTPYSAEAEPWWHEFWLPFGDDNGDIQAIDLRPGPGYGRVGWAAHDNPGDFLDAWPSLEVYLTTVADALETGGAVAAWHAYLTLDGALWWSLGGETELYGEPLRPAPPC